MKRVLTAALFSGILVLGVPQGAFADHAADHGSGQEAGQPQPDGAAEPEASPSPEPERAPAGDRESSNDDEEDFLLF